MAIVRFDPFRDLMTLQERMNRMFDESFRGARTTGDDWALGGSWAPAVDIYEHEGNIVLKAELPGIDSKDVDIRLENNVLTLRGERKYDNEVKQENYHRVERSYGTFQRSFTLPNIIKQSGTPKTAHGPHGIPDGVSIEYADEEPCSGVSLDPCV